MTFIITIYFFIGFIITLPLVLVVVEVVEVLVEVLVHALKTTGHFLMRYKRPFENQIHLVAFSYRVSL